MVSRLKATLAEQIPLLLFVAGNALLQVLFHCSQAETLLRIVKENPSGDDRVLFFSYITALFLGVAVLLFAVGYALDALWQNERLNRVYQGLGVVLQTGIWGLIVINHKVFTVMGVTLDSHFAINALTSEAFTKVLSVSSGTLLSVVGVFGLLALVQYGFLRVCRVAHRMPLDRRRRVAALATGLLVLSLSVSGWAAVRWGIRVTYDASVAVEALPLFKQFIRHKTQEILVVNYPPPRRWPTIAKKRSILLIQVESLRQDAISKELTPNIYAYLQRSGVIRSKKHYAVCHTTEYNTFTNLYGLYPYHYHPFLQDRTPSRPLQILARQGYRLGYATGTPIKNWFGMGFMLRQFDEGREFTKKNDYRNDARLVEWADAFRRRQAEAGRPFFLFLFFGATHHNYLYPPRFERYKPTLGTEYNLMTGDPKWKGFRVQITNRYKNSVLYFDHLFGRLIKHFAGPIEKGELVIVLTGDHGEEFWEFGVLGHGATRFHNPQTRVPLLMQFPGEKSRSVAFSSHTDIWPTIMDYLGVGKQLSLRKHFNGRSLLQPLPDWRYLVIAGNAYPYSNRRVALVTPQRKYWLYKPTTKLTVYKRYKLTDIEDRNLRSTPQIEAEYQRVLKRYAKDVYRFLR